MIHGVEDIGDVDETSRDTPRQQVDQHGTVRFGEGTVLDPDGHGPADLGPGSIEKTDELRRDGEVGEFAQLLDLHRSRLPSQTDGVELGDVSCQPEGGRSDSHDGPSTPHGVATMASQQRGHEFGSDAPTLLDAGEDPLVLQDRPRRGDVVPACHCCRSAGRSIVGFG